MAGGAGNILYVVWLLGDSIKHHFEDLKLLTNRISLLKQEEMRAYKKIDQTRKKAGDIVSQRRRNMEVQQENKKL